MAIVSWRRPQSGLPFTHFFHCPPWSAVSRTGASGCVIVGTTGVVVVKFEDCSHSSERSSTKLPCCVAAFPSSLWIVFRADGVSSFSNRLWTLGSLKNNSSSPFCVLQTLMPWEEWLCFLSCTNSAVSSSSVHLVAARMKSNTARSSSFSFKSAAFSKDVWWHRNATASFSEIVSLCMRDCSRISSLDPICFRRRSEIWPEMRLMSLDTWLNVSRLRSSNSLHSMVTLSRSSTDFSTMPLR
mmetsp:Transcript_84566/g.220841  ORF Transcript_84566/g.220841 Transcript_84566/m.220841 type:complete len:241 (-) Transcript_84566:446-1168(-)